MKGELRHLQASDTCSLVMVVVAIVLDFDLPLLWHLPKFWYLPRHPQAVLEVPHKPACLLLIGFCSQVAFLCLLGAMEHWLAVAWPQAPLVTR